MTLNGVMAATLRYFTEFGNHTLQHITAASICGGIYARVYSTLLYSEVRVRCYRKESSRSLSHLLMSFLFYDAGIEALSLRSRTRTRTRNSSGDEIANVNFLYDDRTRSTKYNRLVHSATDRRAGYVWNACFPNLVK